VAEKRPALGRGLSALIPEGLAAGIAPVAAGDSALEVGLDLLRPNPFQPRLQMSEEGLQALAQSIRTNGVIQPILVRRAGDRYDIVAGERRWRAAQMAGLLKVPVVVRSFADEKLLEIALIENIQRENLNPIDEALAYRRLSTEFNMTQEGIAAAVGKDRTSIANYLRLLKLPEDVQQEVASGALSMGHARAIVALDDPQAVRKAVGEVLGNHLSVRETEALVRRLASPPPVRAEETPKDVHTREAEDVMRLALGTRVRIVRKGSGGHIEIDFVSEDELHRLYEFITGRR
jgi:ParB family transcriptional regulator, chromosome partitioning protein